MKTKDEDEDFPGDCMHTNPSSTDFNVQLTPISNSLRSLTHDLCRSVSLRSVAVRALNWSWSFFNLYGACAACFVRLQPGSLFDRVSAVFFVVALAVALFAGNVCKNLLEVSAKLKQNMRFVCTTVDSRDCAGRVGDSERVGILAAE